MISTGLNSLDGILSGGIAGSAITDIHGSSGVGKTQLLMQISLYAARDGKRVLFQDASRDFRPERMRQIIQSRDLDDALMDSIDVLRLGSTVQQLDAVRRLEDDCPYSVIIVDNVTDLFSFEYYRGDGLQKLVALGRYMHALSRMAADRNVTIVLSNISQIIGGRETESMIHSISPFVHYRIGLYESDGSYMGLAESLFSSGKFAYEISPSGVSDSQDF